MVYKISKAKFYGAYIVNQLFGFYIKINRIGR